MDLAGNDLDVQSGNLAAITGLVRQGFNAPGGGTWNGVGITSSTAAGDTTHLTAVGVIQNNQSGTALFTASNKFDGTTPGAGDVLAAFTYYGDTNLDGSIDGTDYSRIDAAYLADASNPSADTGWFNGDFNYDGTVNGSDYTLMDNAFNSQTAVLATAIQNPPASIATQVAPVPEPMGLGMLAAGIGILSRRRSRTSHSL